MTERPGISALGSDNLRDWYFESTTGTVGVQQDDSLSINGKVIVGSGARQLTI